MNNRARCSVIFYIITKYNLARRKFAMKIVRDENNPNIILEFIFAENEDPVKCLEIFSEIEHNRIAADIEKEKIYGEPQ